MKVSRLTRFSLGACVAAVVVVACGVPQSAVGLLPQSAPMYSGSPATQPDAACPIVGKVYTTGKGHAKVKFSADTFGVGRRPDRVSMDFEFINWPENISLPEWAFQLTTCGAATGKKSIGTVLNKLSPLWYECDRVKHICNYHFPDWVYYEPPLKVPNGKSWKYDEIVVKFKTHLKGFGALPGARIEVVQ